MKAQAKPEEVAPKDSPSSPSTRWLVPQVDISESADAYILEADMPGVDRASLEVTLEGNELRIVGRRPVRVEGLNPVYLESKPYDFRRVFELDPSIDTTRTTAKMEQGILTLHLPKAERVRPRKIQITA